MRCHNRNNLRENLRDKSSLSFACFGENHWVFLLFFFCRLQIGTETHSDSEINKLGVRALPISTMRRFSKLAHRISLITNADGQLQQLDTTHGVIFHFYLSDNRPLILRIHSLVRPWVARALTTGTWSTTDMRFITFLCGNSLFLSNSGNRNKFESR